MPMWCHSGPSPAGTAAREKYSACDTARPCSNTHAAFTKEGLAASSAVSIGATRVAMSTAGSDRGPTTARRAAGSSVGVSPCTLTTMSCRACGSSSPSAACTRSEPEGRDGSVITATPPAARTASAISASAQATATGPIPASCARCITWTIIGNPAMSASGLPGRRVDAMRAGMTMMGVKSQSLACLQMARRSLGMAARACKRTHTEAGSAGDGA